MSLWFYVTGPGFSWRLCCVAHLYARNTSRKDRSLKTIYRCGERLFVLADFSTNHSKVRCRSACTVAQQVMTDAMQRSTKSVYPLIPPLASMRCPLIHRASSVQRNNNAADVFRVCRPGQGVLKCRVVFNWGYCEWLHCWNRFRSGRVQQRLHRFLLRQLFREVFGEHFNAPFMDAYTE